MIDIPDSIFPTDGEGNIICPKCRFCLSGCTCPSWQPRVPRQAKLTPQLRLDKSGRKGKVVTLIEKLPGDEYLLRDLSKGIKAKTASGGTYYCDADQGTIEIQGDHLKTIRAFLIDFNSSGAR